MRAARRERAASGRPNRVRAGAGSPCPRSSGGRAIPKLWLVRGRDLAGGLALALASIAASLLAAELALRLLVPDPEVFRVWPPGLRRVFDTDPDVMPGISGAAHFDVDSRGYRAAERPANPTLSLLAVGGSTTECRYLDTGETWPELVARGLEGRLGASVWSANAGRSGRNTREHVLLLEHLADLGDFDLVIFLIGSNDLLLRLMQDRDWREDEPDSRAQRARHVRRSFAVHPARFEDGWLARSRLWRRVVSPLKARLRGEQRQSDAGDLYVRWRRHRRESPYRRDELPDLTAALAEYRRNVEQLVALARASGVRPVLLTQPALWSADLAPADEALLWMGGIGNHQEEAGAVYYTPAALAAGLARYDDVLRAVAAEREVALVDLAADLPGDPRPFYDDVHFNEPGARAVAEAVVRVLEETPARSASAPGT